MTLTQQIITIAMVVFGTMTTRFLPFLLFPAGKSTPKYLQYLGKVLPSAALSLLVIYCFREISIMNSSLAIPQLLAAAVVVILHLWKRNILLSIAGGTICYMLLIQFVFIS